MQKLKKQVEKYYVQTKNFKTHPQHNKLSKTHP